MFLLYCNAGGADTDAARYPARSGRSGSAFGMSLLALALAEHYGIGSLPEIREDVRGKPFFPGHPALYFSLSHSAGHILCAVADHPVGADIERRRPLRRGTAEKLMSERERRDFDFFQLWTLRESFYKLTGEGSLRTTRFFMENGLPGAPAKGVYSRLYQPADCAAAVCAYTRELPEEPEIVDVSRLVLA